ncbi:MAG: alpha/beta hydrolase [Clostridia bacterium]|nr:alpha/beta hydrolase [Clostridia bacterium]
MKTVLYLHGLGGSAEEAAHYRPLFPDAEVIGLDYHGIAPWEAGKEIREAVLKRKERFDAVSLIGNSIGAFLAMHAGIDALIEKAYFISPVADMESLILARMARDGVTEDELREKGEIRGSAGLTYSWAYLRYVREHPVEWRVPTAVLYGEHDELTPRETIEAFCRANGASLTVMRGGGHWFHTDEQMRFLDNWIRRETEE